jgi:hypothetical protein
MLPNTFLAALFLCLLSFFTKSQALDSSPSLDEVFFRPFHIRANASQVQPSPPLQQPFGLRNLFARQYCPDAQGYGYCGMYQINLCEVVS